MVIAARPFDDIAFSIFPFARIWFRVKNLSFLLYNEMIPLSSEETINRLGLNNRLWIVGDRTSIIKISTSFRIHCITIASLAFTINAYKRPHISSFVREGLTCGRTAL